MAQLPRTHSHLEDRRLHEDVRLLGGCLGQVIRRMEGEEAFQCFQPLEKEVREESVPGSASV